MSLTKKQKDMLHFIKCKYLSSALTNYAGSLYPKEMEADKFVYGDFGNRINFLIYYSPLAGRSSKSRIRAWKTLVALQDKGYIVGFYLNEYGSVNTLEQGIRQAEKWTYWSGLSNLNSDLWEEMDKGDVIVYLTPKGLKANTEINTWSGTAHIRGKIVNLLRKDGKLSPPTTFDEEGNPKNPHLVDELTRLVHADSEKDWIPSYGRGIINQTQFSDDEAIMNLHTIENKIQKELDDKRKKAGRYKPY